MRDNPLLVKFEISFMIVYACWQKSRNDYPAMPIPNLSMYLKLERQK